MKYLLKLFWLIFSKKIDDRLIANSSKWVKDTSNTLFFSYHFPLGKTVGITIKDWSFVKYNADWDITLDTIKHECGHTILRNKIGWIKYDLWLCWDYMRFWVAWKEKPIEIEVEKVKASI